MSHGFWASRVSFIVFALAISVFQIGCAVTDSTATNSTGTDTSPTPTATPSPTPTGESTATSAYFEVSVVTNSNYPTILSAEGDGTTPCRVTASNQDLLCILDMNELDLWARGYQLNYTVPTGACEYIRYYPYFYNIAPVGPAPSLVAYAEDADGNLTSHPGSYAPGDCGAVPAGAEIFYCISGAWVTHSTLFGTTPTKGSKMQCPWDYTNRGDLLVYESGKNCCRGKYDKYVWSVSDGTATESLKNSWGGKEVNCFEGPGIRDAAQPVDPFMGLPMYKIRAVDDKGYSNIIKAEYAYVDMKNIYGSNYYEIADHTPMQAGYPDGPDATQVIKPVAGYYGSSHYRIDCLDANDEVNSRIRILVREWNTNDEFAKFLAGTPAYTSDEAGTETGPDQSSTDTKTYSYPDSDFNDELDWKDLDANATTPENFGLAAGAAPYLYGGKFPKGLVGFAKISDTSGLVSGN